VPAESRSASQESLAPLKSQPYGATEACLLLLLLCTKTAIVILVRGSEAQLFDACTGLQHIDCYLLQAYSVHVVITCNGILFTIRHTDYVIADVQSKRNSFD